MVEIEKAYLLMRASAHRRLLRQAQACEVRLVHRQFVRCYQQRLLALRRAQYASQDRAQMQTCAAYPIFAAIDQPRHEVGPIYHRQRQEEDIFV